MSDESPLQFPCDFPVKAMGTAEHGFEGLVVGIVRRHAPALGEGAVRSRPSRGGKYVSVTVTVPATSRAQIDAIYRDLNERAEVLMVL